jgi:tetratricopeptide (TPR) repeat protein
MTRLQIIVVASVTLFFMILYLGCDTKPKKIKALEKTRALNAETTSIQNLLAAAKEKITVAQSAGVLALEQDLAGKSDSAKVETWKLLSGKWYELGHPEISGYYAQRVAEIDGQEKSWSIAGTTFTICIQNAKEEKIKTYCTEKAVAAYENAISISPENSTNKVNLALAYAENPPKENPMQGIQLLLSLNKENPEDVLVLTTLARLGLKTGQFEKAKQRLEKAISIDSENINANCLLAQTYDQLGDQQNAAVFLNKCNELRK